MRVSPRNHQRQDRSFHRSVNRRAATRMFQQNGMNMPLKVVHRNQRLAQRKRQRFRISNPHQQRPCQPRPTRHSNGVKL